MPQTLAIGAFVLGAVLLLIAVLKGGFKIFGAEVSSSAGTGGRLVAGVLGLVLIVVGFALGHQEPASKPDTVVQAAPPGAGAARPPLLRVAEPALAEEPDTQPQPAPVAAASLQLSWAVSPQDMQWLIHNISDEERTGAFLNALSTGTDVYAARVQLSNTGGRALQFDPSYLRFMVGNENLQSDLLQMPQFLRATRLEPGQQLAGLVLFRAPMLAVGSNQVRLHYADPRVQVSYSH